jgi:hypothetical protein
LGAEAERHADDASARDERADLDPGGAEDRHDGHGPDHDRDQTVEDHADRLGAHLHPSQVDGARVGQGCLFAEPAQTGDTALRQATGEALDQPAQQADRNDGQHDDDEDA